MAKIAQRTKDDSFPFFTLKLSVFFSKPDVFEVQVVCVAHRPGYLLDARNKSHRRSCKALLNSQNGSHLKSKTRSAIQVEAMTMMVADPNCKMTRL
jgi:hypothetical protein